MDPVTGLHIHPPRPRPPFNKEASNKYHSYPTPLYDEMIGKMEKPAGSGELEYGCTKKNTEIFFKYVDKLGRQYLEEPTQGSEFRPVAQPFCFTSGILNGNWLTAFQNAEKYKLYGYRSHENLRQKYVSNSKKNKNKYNNDPWFPNNTLDLVSHPRGKTRASRAPRRMLATKAPRVRPNITANLLGLKNRRHEHKNLLTFGPTEEGLKSRENELKNLFGGKRKTCRNRR